MIATLGRHTLNCYVTIVCYELTAFSDAFFACAIHITAIYG